MHYITVEDQKKIEELINKYLEISNGGEIITPATERIMSELFTKYFDKLVYGVIYNQRYKFWRFSELDELFQEGRLAILSSIHKKQFNPERGSVFNFFSTVVAKNLMNFTKKQNKHVFNNVGIDINDVFNNTNVKYYQNYDDALLIDDAFAALKEFFKGKKKFEELTDLLHHYYEINSGKEFMKKKFIAFAKAHNFSPASVNNFFSYAKRLAFKKEIKNLLEMDDRQ